MHSTKQRAGECAKEDVKSNGISNQSEDVLVRRARCGDKQAFEELVGRARESCLSVATGILRNRDEAQDEVQNAFWKAYTHIGIFSQQSSFSTWVARIAINHCLMHCRRERRVRFVSYDALTPDGASYASHQPVDTRTPEGGFGSAEVAEVVRRELRCIPASLRAPLELRHLHDLSIDEIAGRLGISVSATKSRLHRAQGYLRERVLRHCGGRGVGTLTRTA